MSNEYAEVRVDTRIKTDIKVQHNRPDRYKKKREIILIEVGITNQDLLQTTESENMRKYDLSFNCN